MKKSSVSLNILNLILSLLALYIANSIVVSGFDDNQPYTLAYLLIDGLEIQEAYFVFIEAIGKGVEPVYFLLNYIVNGYLSFNILILVINVFFLYFLYLLLKKFYPKNYQLIYMALLVSNNYIVPLLSDVHRLKLAFLFFMGYLFTRKYRNVFLSLSVFSHFQMIAYLIYRFVDKLYGKFIYQEKIGINKAYLTIFVAGMAALGVRFYDFLYLYLTTPLEYKIDYYSGLPGSWFPIVFWGSIFGIYFTYLNIFKIREFIRVFVPLFATLFGLSLFLNLDRLNLIWFSVIFIVELNRFLTGKRYAILIVGPLFIYSTYGLTRFVLRGLEII